MTRKLTFGYLYDFRNPTAWRRPWNDLYAETLEFIAWSESVGFEGAWVPEHHGAEDGYVPSPLVALAAIAARTKTIKLGSAIALAPLYHPVRFAEECAVLDILANGRLEMAVAIGYRRREAEAYGVDFTSRGRRTDEFLEIVRRLWAGETVSYEGKHFALKSAAIVPTPPRGQIPLYLGGFTEKALERTAKYGDGYFGNLEACDLYLEKLRACGKDPAAARIRIQGLFVVVANDPEKAMHELAPYYHHVNNNDPEKAMHELAPYYHHVNNTYGQWLNEDRAATGFADQTLLQPVSLEAFKTSGILNILTPAQAIEMFKQMLAKAPVEHFMMMAPPGLPTAKFAEYAEVFARQVIPAFR
jgi:alkanesulfonate monooxygenase SsuD/methylene tetrahydromethanopterin reductase-like flavin-dependent oxidoreductase (luciferase family)